MDCKQEKEHQRLNFLCGTNSQVNRGRCDIYNVQYVSPHPGIPMEKCILQAYGVKKGNIWFTKPERASQSLCSSATRGGIDDVLYAELVPQQALDLLTLDLPALRTVNCKFLLSISYLAFVWYGVRNPEVRRHEARDKVIWRLGKKQGNFSHSTTSFRAEHMVPWCEDFTNPRDWYF